MKFEKLFDPIVIGTVELSNRIVNTAHSTGLSVGGHIGERLLAYYEARASGGVAMIIVGTTSVHPTSVSRHQSALSNWDDSVIPSYRELAEITGRYGTKAFVQLNHAGALSGSRDGVSPSLAPSAIANEFSTHLPREMTPLDIELIVEAFGLAARRVAEGGLDGIEVHAGHGNLIQQFLSPLTNGRDDRYGGDWLKRSRFAREVLTSIRQQVGAEFPVGLRLSVYEDRPGGIDVSIAGRIAADLVAHGDLAYVSVTSGSDTEVASLPQHYAPMYLPGQHMRGLAREIKRAVDVPVLCAGRITDPRDAEDILISDDADLIGMTRALIADPDLPKKASAGRLDSIRYCVGINDGCLGRLFRGLPITCVQNPISGRELEHEPIKRAKAPRRVVVVGAGPAGLEAAHISSLRGHDVTVLEASHSPGGLVSIARQAPGRAEIGAITDQLVQRLDSLGVEIRLGIRASVKEILDLDPETVVLATGSEPLIPQFDDADVDRLISARDAYSTGALISGRLAVYDTRGEAEGLTTADLLARRGFDVNLVTSGEIAGWRIEPMTRHILHSRLADSGVSVYPRSEISALTQTGVTIRDLLNGGSTELLEVGTVVVTCGSKARNSLLEPLTERSPNLDVRLAGDAFAPRDIEAAIYDGHMTGRSI